MKSPDDQSIEVKDQELDNQLTRKGWIIGSVAVAVTIGMGVIAILYKDRLMTETTGLSYSLLGVIVVSFLAGSILSFTGIPIPYWFLVLTLPPILAHRWGILSPFLIGLVSALGMTLGHMPTFFLGYGGRSLSQRKSSKFTDNRYSQWYVRWYKKLITWADKHGWIAVFLSSAMFNPLHLAMTVAFGAIRYPPMKFFIFSLLGNIFKSLLLAFAGYYGLTSLFKQLGI